MSFDPVIITRARELAYQAHAGQQRKYNGEPYIVHPEAVAAQVAWVLDGHPMRGEAVAAAWVHDVVEDSDITHEDIRNIIGSRRVARAVWFLTDLDKRHGNRAYRKAFDAGRLSAAPDWVQTIKVCDLMDNTKSIVAEDPEFAKVYLAEKRRLLGHLRLAHGVQWKAAHAQLEEAMYALGLPEPQEPKKSGSHKGRQIGLPPK